MTERTIQTALVNAIQADPRWPSDAPVIPALPGDLETAIQTALGKIGLCVIIGEPDNITSLPGACDFITTSTWAITIFAQELLNPTGLNNLDAACLIRTILADTNPGGHLAEPITQTTIRFVGETDGIIARDLTLTLAYQIN